MADGITTEGALVEVSDDDGATWTPVLERAQLQINMTGDAIDMTSFDDDGWRAKRPGLRQGGAQCSGNYVPSDAGYAILQSSFLDGIPVGLQVSWRTSDPGDPETRGGWTWDEAVITDLGESGNVGDKVELPLKFEGNGRPSVYTA